MNLLLFAFWYELIAQHLIKWSKAELSLPVNPLNTGLDYIRFCIFISILRIKHVNDKT